MKTGAFLAILAIGISLSRGGAWAAPVDLSAPGAELGAANSKGYLEIWREIAGVGLQLDQDSYLPLRYKFSSDPATGGILGPGFYLPMFEAKNVLIRENTMRAYLPCGKGLYFWRATSDPNKFQTPDKAWTGYVTGDDFVAWRDDGWKLLYRKGRLTSIASDNNHNFNWSYEPGGGASISEDGQTVLTLEPNVAGQIAAFVSNGKRYEVEYTERPVTQMILGQVAIKELDQALSTFKYPDGTTDLFKITLTPDLVPTLAFTDKNKKELLFSWNPATGYLMTEKGSGGDWTYKIGAITQEFGTPPIERRASSGKFESVSLDNKMGIYTKVENNITTVTQIFESPGPLFHKIRKIEEVVNGQKTLVFQASYDDMGKLIRKFERTGLVTTYKYDDKGQEIGLHMSLSTDPDFLAKVNKQEKSLLAKLKNALTASGRTAVLNDLIIFYTAKTLQFDKAISLMGLITDKNELFTLKLCLALNPNNPIEKRNQSLSELAGEFPDKKAFVENLEDTEGPR